MCEFLQWTWRQSSPKSSGTVTSSQRFYPMVPESFFRTVWESWLWTEMQQELPFSWRKWSSCNFSLARNMHFLLPLMSKGTWMVSTSVWMLRLVQSVRCQDRVIWANPALICCSHLNLWWAKQWEAVGKTESFTVSEVSIFSGCLMQSCHKPSFFSCSYVTKKIIFQGPTPNQFGQNPLYRAKTLHSSTSVTSNLGYLYSQGICHLGGLSDSSYTFSPHWQGLRPGLPPAHRWGMRGNGCTQCLPSGLRESDASWWGRRPAAPRRAQ